jgi:37-kD nucleoid-associated bacterial protein
MGFLTEQEREELRIESMILHVVGEDIFEPQPVAAVEHEEFFLARILDTDVAPVYRFKAVSGTRDRLQAMATRAVPFEEGGQAVSYEFSRQHGTTTREGAFFIFELLVADPQVRLYSLVKYDYREAIEQAEGQDGQQQLRRIIHAFIDDKRAIQKAALIRVVQGQAEAMVSTLDRTKVSPKIADYFATFLDVERTRSDEELNRTVVDVLRNTFLGCRNLLPNQDAATALQSAKAVLRDRQRIDEEAIVDAVMAGAGHPADEPTQALLRRRIVQKLHSEQLRGLEFPPDRQVLRKPPLRKIRTTEGVTVTYPDEINAVVVNRERVGNGQGEIITITTERIVEDTVVADRAR